MLKNNRISFVYFYLLVSSTKANWSFTLSSLSSPPHAGVKQRTQQMCVCHIITLRVLKEVNELFALSASAREIGFAEGDRKFGFKKKLVMMWFRHKYEALWHWVVTICSQCHIMFVSKYNKIICECTIGETKNKMRKKIRNIIFFAFFMCCKNVKLL